ncbi:MMPL family transporter [Falsarthrobacter nasiphocae]|uniref:RND superfamily putative drug exporter n=1 Tax=Falsarthrobacter nasiphocae TaxID=189863 RepID=A0AAE3YG70_9MICC|nr:MMPL family transporter [Falsarthrobacter nasiphocae]MDR6892202.1 RND superfamily putative drug exporter [Falsarthrobacter nasiphocae]
MASLLYRLGRAAARHKAAFIGVWLVILMAVGGSAAAFHGTFVNSFKLPASESYQTLERLKTELPSASGGQGQVALTSSTPFTEEQKKAVADSVKELKKLNHVDSVRDPFAMQKQLDDGKKKVAEFPAQQKAAQAKIDAGKKKLDDSQKQLDAGKKQLAAAQAQIAQLKAAGMTEQAAAAEQQIAPQLAQLKEGQAKIDAGRKELAAAQKKLDDGAKQVAEGKKQTDSTEGLRFVSENGKAALVSLQFDVQAESLQEEDRQAIQDALKPLADKGINVEYSREIVGQTPSLAGPSEIIGVVIAGILLFIMLGTLIAAGLPLLTAIVGVGVGIGGTVALSGLIEFTSVSMTLGSMLGLAVGIDYSLFIINRYRSNRLKGLDKIESIALAVGTAGNAVTFAGLTVIIALAALTVTGIPFLGTMGLVGAATIAVSVLVALTLTPALISLIGRHAMPKKMRAIAEKNEKQITSGSTVADHQVADRRWGAIVTRMPWLTVAVSVIALGLLAIPAAHLKLALPDASSEASESTQYKAYKVVADNFGEGANGPLVIVTDLPEGLSEKEAKDIQYKVADRVRANDDVVAAVPGALSENRQTGVIQVIPKEGPASDSTKDLVNTLKSEQASVKDETGALMHVSGQSAIQIDVSQTLAKALPVYLAVVVGLSLILLLLVFRSILVPLIATAGFLLSLFATLGAVVAIYQDGFLADLFQVNQPGPILSFLPTMVVGILFGLAMDYQMFLVSGMREAHVHGEDARRAVRTGFNHGARVVTVAALIMVSVFAGFIFSHETMIKPMGFGLAFGVLIDAFVIRMTLTPAVLHLLGDKAWWIPGWLDRILPDADVEGAKLEASRASHARETND